MASQIMRITLKAYDHQLIDASAKSIIETVKKTGSKVSGPVPMPTKKEVVTILRAVHKYKDSREQFEQRTHKRLISVEFYEDTHGNVYSHRLSYLVYKVRKGGDFFYGKSSNENHTQGI